MADPSFFDDAVAAVDAPVSGSKPREGVPEFWVTSLAKALSGDMPCHLSPWLSAHYKLKKRKKSDEDEAKLATWKADHSALLTSYTDKMRVEGFRCTVEQYFKVQGVLANVAGKCDLIIQKQDVRPCIVDTKTGEGRDSDLLQVMIEMILIPMAWGKNMIFSGRVVYVDRVVEISANQAEELKPKLFALIKKLAAKERPAASPGVSACRWCDVASFDCAERVEEAPAGSTQEF